MKLICYQDEKMYGPPQEGTTKEALEEKIRELEIKIYGHELSEPSDLKTSGGMIYDIEAKGFAKYEAFVKTERGKKFLEETNRLSDCGV